MRIAELILGQNRVRVHEQLGQDNGKNCSHRNANNLVAKLHYPVGTQSPTCRSILLHIAAFTTGNQEDGSGQKTDSWVAQSQGRHQKDTQHKRTGDRVPIRDPERYAVNQNKQKRKQDRDRQEKPGLMQHLAADYHNAGSPEQHPDDETHLVDSFPILLRGRRLRTLFYEPPDSLYQNQDNIDDGCTQDRA